jgi:ppGpp synthetase/RelA/SpoT-type nucleotidyltranferase
VLEKVYEQRKPILERASARLKSHVIEIHKKYEGSANLRIIYVDGRIKSIGSLINKALTRGVEASQVFETIFDIVGVRIVVNTVSDVDRLIKELEKIPGLIHKQTEQHEASDGYRVEKGTFFFFVTVCWLPDWLLW